IRGDRNGAGELGHFAIDPAGERCGCGQRGCLETFVGGRHLTARLAGLGLDLAGLGTALAPVATAERDRLVGALATGLTLVVISYDSAAVTLGGGVLRTADWLLPAVRQTLTERAASSSFLAGLRVADRLIVLPGDVPVAAIGAAVVGRKKGLHARHDLVRSQS
ncbi:MAG: ROK family protein, partial [Propionicimonas sp.]|nr:ROK family protein [Propionicimonas sp.]